MKPIKVSDLIQKLQAFQANFGDVPVGLHDNDYRIRVLPHHTAVSYADTYYDEETDSELTGIVATLVSE